MKGIGSKKGLEIMLSRLKGFKKARIGEEQYLTPSSIAAEVLWKALFNGNIEGKKVADLGSGTGILGIGSMLLGAREIYFVERDKEAIKILQENLRILESGGFKAMVRIVNSDVSKFSCKVDTVIMNPPFGTKRKNADRAFLEKAFCIASEIYSFHKTSTMNFISRFCERNGFKISERFDFDFMIGNTMLHHRKKREYVKVSCFHLRKKAARESRS